MVENLVHNALVVATALLQALFEFVPANADLVLDVPRMQLIVDELVHLVDAGALRCVAASPPCVNEVLSLLLDIASILVVDREHAERLELSVEIVQLFSIEWSCLRKLVDTAKFFAVRIEFLVLFVDKINVCLLNALRLQALAVEVREEASIKTVLQPLVILLVKVDELPLDAWLDHLLLLGDEEFSYADLVLVLEPNARRGHNRRHCRAHGRFGGLETRAACNAWHRCAELFKPFSINHVQRSFAAFNRAIARKDILPVLADVLHFLDGLGVHRLEKRLIILAIGRFVRVK